MAIKNAVGFARSIGPQRCSIYEAKPGLAPQDQVIAVFFLDVFVAMLYNMYSQKKSTPMLPNCWLYNQITVRNTLLVISQTVFHRIPTLLMENITN